MFSYQVDNELKLALVQPSFAKNYLELVNADFKYLDQWLIWPQHCKTEQAFVSFVQKSLHDYADGKSLTCAMIYQEKVVGNISFNTIRHDLKSAEIGYWLASEYQGKGIVSRSVEALIEQAFTKLALEKVQISAATANQPSRKVCERLGFRLEGVISHAENLNGRIVDHAKYALHKEDWLSRNRKSQ